MSIDALPNSDSGTDLDAADDPEPARDLLIHLDAETSSPPDTRWIEEKLRAVFDQLKLESLALNVVIVDDDAIADMHARFLDVEGTTDVITFDLSDAAPDSTARRIDGELYICLDEAARQAEKFDHSVEAELLLYAVHGLLHLLGYDDHDPENHRIMHDTEDQLLTAIGVGPVFARRDGGAR